jgi:hypothetical protein
LTLTPAADWKLRSTISDDGSGSCFRIHANTLCAAFLVTGCGIGLVVRGCWDGALCLLPVSCRVLPSKALPCAPLGCSFAPPQFPLCRLPRRTPRHLSARPAALVKRQARKPQTRSSSSALLVLTPWILQHLLLPPSSFHHRWRQSGSHLFPERPTTLPTSSPRKKKRSFFIR